MYDVIFYEDEDGNSPVFEYIQELGQKEHKSARVVYRKITAYIETLCEKGTRMGMPFTRHLEDDIWELRPLNDRILYAYYKDNTFILLHQFKKKSQKTPTREIEKAKRNLNSYLERA